MIWDQPTIDGIDLALNESQVCGLLFDLSLGVARLLLEVLALPEVGAVDRDPRRVLVLGGVRKVEVILYRDQGQDPGVVVALESVEALEAFFASLTQAEPMYGWSFIDIADPSADWNVTPSLALSSAGSAGGDHTLHWFTECGRSGPGESWQRFTVQGVLLFHELAVERADSSPVPVDEFIGAARRWWRAFESGDPRLSTDAQQHAQSRSLSWRSWGGSSVMVPGNPS